MSFRLLAMIATLLTVSSCAAVRDNPIEVAGMVQHPETTTTIEAAGDVVNISPNLAYGGAEFLILLAAGLLLWEKRRIEKALEAAIYGVEWGHRDPKTKVASWSRFLKVSDLVHKRVRRYIHNE